MDICIVILCMWQCAGPPISPTDLWQVLRHSADHANVELNWESNEFADYFFISIPHSGSTMIATTPNKSVEIFSLLYNQEYNISVVASNCAGNSTPANITVFVGEQKIISAHASLSC